MNGQISRTGIVLSNLQEAIRQFDESADIYLKQIGNNEILNPVQNGLRAGSMGINESIPPGFFAGFGIRSLILNAFHGKLSFSDLFNMDPGCENSVHHPWRGFMNELVVEDLKMLFRNCRIATFANRAGNCHVTDLWDSLRRDVIKPVGKRDADFIFYLTDYTGKSVFDMDDTLDIISDFSLHGRVTLVLEENEAVGLCNGLNGRDTGFNFRDRYLQDLKGEFFSLFNTMSIDYLLIYSVDHALLFSKRDQFEISGRIFYSRELLPLKEVWDDFNAGYSLGLLFRLDIRLCIALGLAVSGAHRENGSLPDRETLTLYIRERMAEPVTPESTEMSFSKSLNLYSPAQIVHP
jgi:hypothetical protein